MEHEILEYHLDWVKDLVDEAFENIPFPRSSPAGTRQYRSYVRRCLGDIELRSCGEAVEDHEKYWRQFCHVLHYPGVICYTPQMASLPDKNIRGLFAHEFGHIIAEVYPGIIVRESDLYIERRIAGKYGTAVIRFFMDGLHVDGEVFADAVMERLLGIRIFYDHNKIQIFYDHHKIQWIPELRGKEMVGRRK